MEKVRSNDGTWLSYQKVGRGPALVLLHGGLTDSANWAQVIPHFAKNFTVYALDRRGHGASEPYRPGHTIEREYEDVLALITAINRPTFLLGHSVGGHIALQIGRRSQLISKLVLYEPPVIGDGTIGPEVLNKLQQCLIADDLSGIVINAMNVVLVKSTGHPLQPQAIAGFLQSPLGQLALRNARSIPAEMAAYDAYHFAVEDFQSLAIPTLLLVGGNSPAFSRIITDQLQALLPDSRIRLLPGQEHGAMVSAPELFATIVYDFLLS